MIDHLNSKNKGRGVKYGFVLSVHLQLYPVRNWRWNVHNIESYCPFVLLYKTKQHHFTM